MESSKAKRSGRTAAQKKLRHERNKGPWTCGFCEHGFRNHSIIEHQQNCSWTGKVTAPNDGDHLTALTSSVRRSQLHISVKRRREANPHEEESSSSDLTPPAIRCCRIRMSPPSGLISTSTSRTQSAGPPQTPENEIPIIDDARSKRVGKHSVECQTPLTESLFLPEGLTLQLLLDIVHANPGLGADSLMRLVCQSRPVGLPDQQYVVVQLVLHGMVMAASRIARVVHEQVQLLSTLDPNSEASIRQRIAAMEHINGLIRRTPTHPPQPLSPIDFTNLPADVDVISTRGRNMIYAAKLTGRRPPSPDVEGEINGAASAYLEISDDDSAAPDESSSGD